MRPQVAPPEVWEASFKNHVAQLVAQFRDGIPDYRVAEILLEAFNKLAGEIISNGGGIASPHAIRALADKLLALPPAS